MQVTINIDDEMFNKIFGEEVSKLDAKEVKDILIECIKEYFSQDNYARIEKLLITESDNYFYQTPKFTEFGNKLINSCDYSKLQEVVDKVIECMVNDHERILKEMLIEVIARGFISSYSMQQAFEERILPLDFAIKS